METAALLVIPVQFLTRRIRAGWLLIGVAFVACFFIRLGWRWDVMSGGLAVRHAARFEERPEDRTAAVEMDPTLRKSRADSRELPNLFGTTGWNPAGFYAPTFVKNTKGFPVMRSSGLWEKEAGRRLLGLESGVGPLRCQLIGSPLLNVDGENPAFAGTLEIWFVRPRLIGEAPLRAGAGFQSGANRTRILHLERNDEQRLDAIFLEERNSFAAFDRSWSVNWSPGDAQRIVIIDRYFIVDRARGKAQGLSAGELGWIEFNGIMTRYRRLSVAGEDDWKDAALVKIRFECDHRFERPIELRGMSFARPFSPR
jgi:hypothetical protein